MLGHNPSETAWRTGLAYGHPANRMTQLLSSSRCQPKWMSLREQDALPAACGVGFLDTCSLPGNMASDWSPHQMAAVWRPQAFARLRWHMIRSRILLDARFRRSLAHEAARALLASTARESSGVPIDAVSSKSQIQSMPETEALFSSGIASSRPQEKGATGIEQTGNSEQDTAACLALAAVRSMAAAARQAHSRIEFLRSVAWPGPAYPDNTGPAYQDKTASSDSSAQLARESQVAAASEQQSKGDDVSVSLKSASKSGAYSTIASGTMVPGDTEAAGIAASRPSRIAASTDRSSRDAQAYRSRIDQHAIFSVDRLLLEAAPPFVFSGRGGVGTATSSTAAAAASVAVAGNSEKHVIRTAPESPRQTVLGEKSKRSRSLGYFADSSGEGTAPNKRPRVETQPSRRSASVAGAPESDCDRVGGTDAQIAAFLQQCVAILDKVDTTAPEWRSYAPRVLAVTGRKQFLDIFAKASAAARKPSSTSSRQDHRAASTGGRTESSTTSSASKSSSSSSSSSDSALRDGSSSMCGHSKPTSGAPSACSLPLNSPGAPSRAALTAALGKPFTPSQGTRPSAASVRDSTVVEVIHGPAGSTVPSSAASSKAATKHAFSRPDHPASAEDQDEVVDLLSSQESGKDSDAGEDRSRDLRANSRIQVPAPPGWPFPPNSCVVLSLLSSSGRASAFSQHRDLQFSLLASMVNGSPWPRGE